MSKLAHSGDADMDAIEREGRALENREFTPVKSITRDQQLAEWVKGNPIHGDECCPDFSCCRPELLAPEDVRIAFRDHPESRHEMLGMFLGKAIATYTKKKVYVAGLGVGEETND